MNTLLVVFQAVAAVVSVESCRHLGGVERYPTLTWDVAKKWAPVNIAFCFMLFAGMASLQSNSVPMVTVFKNGAFLRFQLFVPFTFVRGSRIIFLLVDAAAFVANQSAYLVAISHRSLWRTFFLSLFLLPALPRLNNKTFFAASRALLRFKLIITYALKNKYNNPAQSPTSLRGSATTSSSGTTRNRWGCWRSA